MNDIEQKLNAPVEMTPEKKLEIFIVEMKKIKEIEMNKKQAWEERGKVGEAYNPHFNGINPDYLGQAEREVYEKYENNNLTVEEFQALKKSAMEKSKDLPVEDKKTTLDNFWGHMSNLMQIKEGRRQLNELKQKKSQ